MTDDDVQEDIEDLRAKVNSFRDGLQNAWDAIDELEAELQEERVERERLEEENKQLRERLDELDARTDLLSVVQNSDEMTGRQRSLTLIQHLKEQAETQDERTGDAKASLTREQAESALQYPDVDRTTIYDDMRRAERLVGDKSVLQYRSASGGESRLELNLDAGNLPGDVVAEAGGR